MKTSRISSLSQLTLVMAGFAATILFLESQALVSWADRLDVGPARTRALLATTSIHGVLSPLHADRLRSQTLTALDRLGWSDDPARLEQAQTRLVGFTSARNLPCSAKPVIASPARGASTALISAVPLKTPLPQLAPLTGNQPRTVALVGDSMMAVGLSNVLLRDAANNPDLKVIRAFKSGTGLARPDVFDWMTEYPAMIGTNHPDAIIVAIGANDGQGFIDNGKTVAFGSDAWTRAYQQRTAAFLELLTQNGAHVVWVGLPPMRNGQYNAHIATINRIAYTVVSQYPQATWWNPQSLIGDDSGQYREFGVTPDGKTSRLRQSDGIHLSDEGASLLTPTLMNWLNAVPAQQTAHLEKTAAPKGR